MREVNQRVLTVHCTIREVLPAHRVEPAQARSFVTAAAPAARFATATAERAAQCAQKVAPARHAGGDVFLVVLTAAVSKKAVHVERHAVSGVRAQVPPRAAVCASA
jgi:hypothetical protein